MTHPMKTFFSLRPLLLALAPLPLALGCANMCGEADPVSNESSGSFTYQSTPTGRTSSGPLPTSTLQISAPESGTVSISGSFTDASGLGHQFTISLLDVTSQTDAPVSSGSTVWLADCSPGDTDGACTYSNQAMGPLEGSLITGGFSTDCHGSQGCAISITATLHAVATIGSAVLDTNIDLSSQSTWQTYACPSSNDDSS
jgi:hypothetical protein